MAVSTNENDSVVADNQVKVLGIATPVRPMELELLVALCYTVISGLLFVPSLTTLTVSPLNIPPGDAFRYSLWSFLLIEFLIGVTLPCEGVIRSIYIPSSGRATMLILPRIVVNVAVAVGVILTRYLT
jgi:hypothetical protein